MPPSKAEVPNPGRRRFFQEAGWTVLKGVGFTTAVSGILSLPWWLELGSTVFPHEIQPFIDAKKQELYRRHGVILNFDLPAPGEVDPELGFVPLTPLEQYKLASSWLPEKLDKYPPGFLAGHCRIAAFQSAKVVSERTGMVPSLEKRTVYLGLYPGFLDIFASGIEDSLIGKQVYFHVTQMALYADPSWYSRQIASWPELNPEGQSAYIGISYLREPLYPAGFAHHAGKEEPAMDMLTVAEYLFTQPAWLARRTKRDPVLRGKVERIKMFYGWWTDGQMNDQYWEDLRQGRVTEEYWVR
jgi:hypothetical protein